jgi:hypothetical protein
LYKNNYINATDLREEAIQAYKLPKDGNTVQQIGRQMPNKKYNSTLLSDGHDKGHMNQ